MSHENIKGEVDATLSDLTQKGEKNLFANAKNMLSSLDLIDLDGNIDTTSSIFARVILDEFEKNKGKNVKVDELIEKLRSEPFGLNDELTQLLLAVLTYNGKINLRKRGGGTITSSDLPDIFKSGIDAFRDIPYATLETEFPIDAIVKLFRALNLNQGLVRNPKDRTKAVQEFRAKALDLSETLTSIERGIQEMSSKQEPIIRPEELSKTIDELSEFPIDEFLAVKTVNDFKKVEYTDDEISMIKKSLDLIANIKGFIDDYNGFIHTEYTYLKKSLAWLDSYPSIFSDADKAPLNEIHAECKPLIHEFSNILDSEQRRMLKGKLQQYKRKYIPLYYTKHTRTIGVGIDWDKLERISRSNELKKLRDMKAVRGVNPLNLNKLEERILALSKARCTNLTEEHLKDNYRCSWCSFPETLKGIADINTEIEEIHKSVAVISNEWTKTILNEIETYRDNIELLSDPEKAVIAEIEAERRLPDEMAQELITALNNLFSELREVEISPREIVDFIFSDFSVLDYDAFSRKLEDYKEKILERGEKRNIRIKRREV